MASLIEETHEKAVAAAEVAVQEFCDKHFGGTDGGACGFAWVEYFPLSKGNTRDGKEERRMIERLGFRKSFTGKHYELRSFCGRHLQSVDAKSAGCQAYVRVMREELCLENFYAADRLD